MQILFHEHSELVELEFREHGKMIHQVLEEKKVANDVVHQVQLVDEHDENDEITIHTVAVVGEIEMHDVQQVEKTVELVEHDNDIIC